MAVQADQAAGLRRTGVPTAAGRREQQRITCLAVASGKGGVGKTFVAVNLALAFSQLRRKVLLVDADLGLANSDIALGVTPQHTLEEALFQGLDLREVVSPTAYPGVDLLAASSGTRQMVNLGEARVSSFIKELLRFAGGYEVLIFDCAAGIGNLVTAFVTAAPQTLVVANPYPTSIVDVYALIKVIHQEALDTEVSVVMNMVDDEEYAGRVMERLQAVVKNYLDINVQAIGNIPYSEGVAASLQRRKPLLAVAPDDPAARQLQLLARSILQKHAGAVELAKLNVPRLLQAMLKG
jgi:flagellar biosynthesis protein FlhG